MPKIIKTRIALTPTLPPTILPTILPTNNSVSINNNITYIKQIKVSTSSQTMITATKQYSNNIWSNINDSTIIIVAAIIGFTIITIFIALLLYLFMRQKRKDEIDNNRQVYLEKKLAELTNKNNKINKQNNSNINENVELGLHYKNEHHQHTVGKNNDNETNNDENSNESIYEIVYENNTCMTHDSQIEGHITSIESSIHKPTKQQGETLVN